MNPTTDRPARARCTGPLWLRRTTLTLCIIAAAIATAACKKQQPAAKPTTEIHTYTTRGQVAQLPVAGDDRTDFMVRHEAIPEFRGPQGERGMDTMVMPFPIRDEPAISLDGLAPGDKVQITFDVVFDLVKDQPVDWYAVKVEKLAADTALDFRSIRKD